MARDQRDQRALRAARRAARESARGRGNALPRSTTRRAVEANRAYAQGVIDGTIPAPSKDSIEGRGLARWASFARWGKAPAEFSNLENYFYKDNGKSTEGEDEE